MVGPQQHRWRYTTLPNTELVEYGGDRDRCAGYWTVPTTDCHQTASMPESTHVIEWIAEDARIKPLYPSIQKRVELTTVRSKVEFIIGPGERLASGEIRLTDRVKKVIELAVEESRWSDHNNIDTEHLLIGLLREGDGIAAGVLKSMGVNEERIRGEVARLSQDSE